MDWKALQKAIDSMLVVDKNTLRSLEESENALDQNIKYWLKTGKLIALKKGLYIPKKMWLEENDKDGYLEYIANYLLRPSYVSLDYVLSKYRLLTESSSVVTSVTTGTGRSFSNEISTFDYRSVSDKIFTGYEVKSYKNAFVKIASKEKALFDFLYLRFWNREPNEINIDNLRINWENLTKKELETSREFCRLSRSKKIERTFDVIKGVYQFSDI